MITVRTVGGKIKMDIVKPDLPPGPDETLVERLRSYAQNNEMIDQNFTESGHAMNEAADELVRLSGRVQELERALTKFRERATKAIANGGLPHYKGCENNHTNCRYVKEIDAALAGGDKG